MTRGRETQTVEPMKQEPNPVFAPKGADAQNADLDNRFTYHAPHGDQIARYGMLRGAARNYAQIIVELTPQSREQAVALTNLEQATFWANAAIARNEKPIESTEEPWLQRLRAEHEELAGRLAKIDAFLDSDAFNSVGPEQQTLLTEQRQQMRTLIGTLSQRLRVAANH